MSYGRPESDRIPAAYTGHPYPIWSATHNAVPVTTNTFFFFQDDDDTGNSYADTADPCRKFQEFFLNRCRAHPVQCRDRFQCGRKVKLHVHLPVPARHCFPRARQRDRHAGGRGIPQERKDRHRTGPCHQGGIPAGHGDGGRRYRAKRPPAAGPEGLRVVLRVRDQVRRGGGRFCHNPGPARDRVHDISL